MRSPSPSSLIRLLALCALALAACAAPTAIPPTTVPTLPPTATALPPTLAPAPQSTAAPLSVPVPATSIALSGPNDIAFDADGNLYVATCDQGGPQLYKVDSLGLLTVYASRFPSRIAIGDGGPALAAGIGCPGGLTADRAGNLYVTDTWNNRIRRIDRNGIINTVAGSGPPDDIQGGYGGDDGPATSALLSVPNGVAIDSDGNLYIADTNNNRIRKVDRNGIITTVAGNGQRGFSGDGGPATMAALNQPVSIAFDAQGNLYFADSGNSRVRQVDQQGTISTIAGTGGPTVSGDGGPATTAVLSKPLGLTFDADGNLYIACAPSTTIFDARIRKIDGRGIITTVAGTGVLDFSGDDGPATAATFRLLAGIHFDAHGNLYIVDFGNDRVRKVDKQGIITTVVGGRP